MTRYAARYSASRSQPVTGRKYSAASMTAVIRMRVSIFFCFFVMGKPSVEVRPEVCPRGGVIYR